MAAVTGRTVRWRGVEGYFDHARSWAKGKPARQCVALGELPYARDRYRAEVEEGCWLELTLRPVLKESRSLK